MEQDSTAPADVSGQAPYPDGDSHQLPAQSRMSISGTNPAGGDFSGSPEQIMGDLVQKGAPIKGISPDGSRFIVPDPDDPSRTREADIKQTMEGNGYKINSMLPLDAKTGQESTWLSAATPTLNSDTQQHRYISNTMKSNGDSDPRVVQSNGSFYHYDNGQWNRVAKPTGGITDADGLLNAALDAPHQIATGVGAMAAKLNPAMGAALGSAGGFVGHGITNEILNNADPNYWDASTRMGSEEWKKLGLNAGGDAATGAIMAPVAGVLGKVGGGLMDFASQKLAPAMKSVGNTLSKKGVAAFVSDVGPGPGFAADIAQLPTKGAVAAAKTLRGLQDSPIAQKIFSEEQLAKAASKGEDLLQYGDNAQGIGRAIDVGLRQNAIMQSEEQALKAGTAQELPMTSEEADARFAAQQVGHQAGMGTEELQALGDEVAKPFARNIDPWRGISEQAPPGPAENVGALFDATHDIGQSVKGAITGAYQGAGGALSGAGRALRAVTGDNAQNVAQGLGAYLGPQAASRVRDYLLSKYHDKQQ